ncbi:hypothetical protein ACHAP4_010254 [Fusarium culmorum]
MAEIFGIVSGALSVAAIFNNCVDTFEYIQLGRHFGEDFQRYQLKLELAKTRLGRWGEAISINKEPRFSSFTSADKEVNIAREILEDIASCFEGAQKKSSRYADRADQRELEVFGESDMNPMLQRLHKHSKDIARQRQKTTSIIKKAKWALYDAKSLERTIDQICSWVDELEKLFPAESAQTQLVEREIEMIDDKPSLEALEDAASGVDPVMEDAVQRKLNMIEGHNSVEFVNLEGSAKFLVGNVFSEKFLQRDVLLNDRTKNSMRTISATHQSRLQVGNVYGGRGFWED